MKPLRETIHLVSMEDLVDRLSRCYDKRANGELTRRQLFLGALRFIHDEVKYAPMGLKIQAGELNVCVLLNAECRDFITRWMDSVVDSLFNRNRTDTIVATMRVQVLSEESILVTLLEEIE